MELWILRCSLLALLSTAAQPGMDLSCSNDYDFTMSCRFGSDHPDRCNEYKLHTKVMSYGGFTERSCSLRAEERSGGAAAHCSCDLTQKIYPGDVHNTTLWRAGSLVTTKQIPVSQNILPKAPKLISVERDTENGNYHVKWITNYNENVPFNLIHTVTYQRKGEKGTLQEANTSDTSYDIPANSLEPSTEYLVNVRSSSSYSSKSTEDVFFTTPG